MTFDVRRLAMEMAIGGPKFEGGAEIEESPPDISSPQVTTEPLLFKAAKANWVDAIDLTPEVRFPPTGKEETPPENGIPQVTTEPFDLRAAKAFGFE